VCLFFSLLWLFVNPPFQFSCKSRLANLGHEIEDIDFVGGNISGLLRAQSVYRLTPRGGFDFKALIKSQNILFEAFREIRPRLEEIVTNRKVQRLKHERRMLLESLYTTYQRTFVEPDSWQYHPPLTFVMSIAEFSGFLNAKYDTRGDVNSSFAMTVFPSSVINWIQAQGERIAPHVKLSSSESLPEEAFFKMPCLDLATSIMICDNCKDRSTRGLALVGSENILRHICLEANPHCSPCQAIRLDEGACAAAASLVSCLGLDPKTTTFKEMDERDARFFCGNCMSETSRGITGLKVYTWMECVRILSHHPRFRWY
jgi:hypothetical protein